MVKLTENFLEMNIAFLMSFEFYVMIWTCTDELVSSQTNILEQCSKTFVGLAGTGISVDPWFTVDKANGKAKLLNKPEGQKSQS